MRVTCSVLLVLAISACSNPVGPRPQAHDAAAASDAGPISAGDVLFPDAEPPVTDAEVLPEPLPDAFAASVTIGPGQVLAWKSACAAVAAESQPLAPGSYTVTLSASDMSKGSGKDNYLLVALPIAAGSAEESLRHVVLNGVGDQQSFSVSAPGVVRAWFIDSDTLYNTGSATLTIGPGAQSLEVDPGVHVIAWQGACKSAPAELELPAGKHRLTLSASSYSSAPGQSDPAVVVRLPLEGDEPTKYLSLNGVGDSVVVELPAFGILRAWLLAESTGAESGQATVTVTAP
jgi:hypothetical protein